MGNKLGLSKVCDKGTQNGLQRSKCLPWQLLEHPPVPGDAAGGGRECRWWGQG